MIQLSDADISLLLSSLLWPLFRISGFLIVDPFFGSKAVTKRIKIILALSLTIIIAPNLPPMPAVPVVSAEGLAIIVHQLMIGIALGMIMRLIITAVEMAGMLMSAQMGLGFAMMFDPIFAAQVPSLSRFMTLLVFLLFIALNGHLVIISTLIDSFRVLPVSIDPLPSEGFKLLAEWGAKIFSLGLWMSLPVVGALLITNIAIGVMTRAAPQFNIFSFGFPLTLGIGFIALYLALPYFAGVTMHLYEQGAEMMISLLKVRALKP